jgi:hypothetical protein
MQIWPESIASKMATLEELVRMRENREQKNISRHDLHNL